MADPVYVNRARFTSSLDKQLVEPFDSLAKKSRIPKSRLFFFFFEDLLKKYEKKNG